MPVLSEGGVLNAASGRPGPVAPGEMVIVRGQGLGPAKAVDSQLSDDGKSILNLIAGVQLLFDGIPAKPRDYLLPNVGDVHDETGKAPRLALLPGSLMLEDAQGELYIKEARQAKDPDVVGTRVRGRLERMIRRFEGNYDVVILDCAPGLSFAALAALKTADLVLVPFRPDYVSQLAVDRVALLIEGRRTGADLAEQPLDARRYACVANSMRGTGREQNIFDEIALDHPMLNARLPQSAAIADAFDYRDDPRSIEDKYGDATGDVRAMYEEVASRLTLRLAA